ncbi:flagellar hook assembly protein FlgD [Sphingomonas sp. MMS24-JH45]
MRRGWRARGDGAQRGDVRIGLAFDSLLKICSILTQLTYQDPLKPMDNFQFVSQLAQFSQIQLGQSTNDNLAALVNAQGALQASGLLGREVDVRRGAAPHRGRRRSASPRERRGWTSSAPATTNHQRPRAGVVVQVREVR